MWTSWKFWAVWVIVLGLIILLAFGFTTDPKNVPSPLMGRSAPDFQVDELNGEQKFSLSEFKGIPIVLNFWASWCTECRTEAVILENFFLHSIHQLENPGQVCLIKGTVLFWGQL